MDSVICFPYCCILRQLGSLYPDLMITNVAVWRRPLSLSTSTQRHGRRVPPRLLSPANRLILYLRIHTVGILLRSQKVCHQSLPPAMSYFTWRGTPSTKTDCGLYTSSPDLCRILWYIDFAPSWITRDFRPGNSCVRDLKTLSGRQPPLPSPHNDRACWRAQWEVTCCLYVWHCASRQPPGSDSAFWLQYASPSSDIALLFHSRLGRNRKLTPQSFAKALNSLLQKTVSLSVRSSCGGPRSKNTVSSWRITLAESCLANCLQIEKRDGPQSVSVRKWCAP